MEQISDEENTNETAVEQPVVTEEPPAAPKRRRATRKKAAPEESAEAKEAPAKEDVPAEKAAPAKTTRRRTTKKTEEPVEDAAAESKDAPAEPEEAPEKEEVKKAPRKRATSTRSKKAADEAKKEDSEQTVTEADSPTEVDSAAETATEEKQEEDSAAGDSDSNKTRTRTRRKASTEEEDTDDSKRQPRKRSNNKTQNKSRDSEEQQEEEQPRSSRTRQRDRKRRNPHNDDLLDPELTEDDVLLPIAGILDVLDNYAFVRTTGYLAGPSDVYVSLSQIKKYNLRKGDAIVGAIRKPQDGEGGGRQKYNAIVKIESVNGQPLVEDMKRVDFADLTPLYPQERLRLETTPEKVTQRMIDLIAPVGKGQRGLIVAPPKAGKTVVLQQIANAVAENNPEAHLMVVLVDERPEEVTEMQRTVKGEVVASTFDRPAEDHITVSELAIERAKRLVELGHDVVILLDSITRLSRAYNVTSPHSGRVLTGGVDAQALYPPKRFFGAARNIENGGSLTILATALVETGSKADEVIFEEFKGTGNMELRLSRQLADRRIFPAVDLNASSTRREEMLLTPDEVRITWKLRRALGNLTEEQAAELVLGKLKETSSNVEFLMLMQKTGGLV